MVAINLSTLFIAAGALITAAEAQKKPTFKVDALPDKWEKNQVGTNQCRQKYGDSSAKSMCQNVFVNSADDFCLFAPYVPGSTVGNEEERAIAYCTKSGYGTRVFPPGTIKGAQFLRTPDYIQVTGYGDFTKIGLRKGDDGGELDPHGATGTGNPAGGLVFTRSAPGDNRKDKYVQIKEWSSFLSDRMFSIRLGYGAHRREYAPHIYDVMGAQWNHPGKYKKGVFEDCEGNSGEWPGVYKGSTFWQGQPKTPAAHPVPASSQCKARPSPDGGAAEKKPYRKRGHNTLPTAHAEII